MRDIDVEFLSVRQSVRPMLVLLRKDLTHHEGFNPSAIHAPQFLKPP